LKRGTNLSLAVRLKVLRKFEVYGEKASEKDVLFFADVYRPPKVRP